MKLLLMAMHPSSPMTRTKMQQMPLLLLQMLMQVGKKRKRKRSSHQMKLTLLLLSSRNVDSVPITSLGIRVKSSAESSLITGLTRLSKHL